jgi:hypothetical protein
MIIGGGTTVTGLSVARTAPRGALAGLAHLGCTPETEQAW